MKLIPAFACRSGLVVSLATMSRAAWAQGIDTASSSLAPASDGDWAAAFINFLFKGDVLPDTISFTSARLVPIAESLRDAMSTYSLAMLVLAGILLFYHLTVIVAETAHEGVFMGRRTNQIWAPIRLGVAVILLVPMGSGLSAGQHIILKIASSGSNLASHAWVALSGSMNSNFFNLVAPRGPDAGRFIAASVEMEACRQIYEQMRLPPAVSTSAHLAGNMGDIGKIPASSLTPETWRYSNSLNAAMPMCGEYRFSGYRHHNVTNSQYTDGIARIADSIADFSHTEAESTLMQARAVGIRIGSSFSGSDANEPLNSQDELAADTAMLKQQIDNHLKTLSAAQTSLSGKYFTQSAEAGWITSAFFIPDLVRMQESYGELVDHILPDVQEPVFIHRHLTDQVAMDAINAEPALRMMDKDIINNLLHFYANISRANARMHGWLYDSQMSDTGFVTTSGFNLRDQINSATDVDGAFAIFSHAIDTAAISRGVWGAVPGENDFGNPFTLSTHTELYNPITALIEFGRRQLNLGTYLAGLAGSVISIPQITTPALLMMLLGGVFLAGGAVLIFLVPVLPFMRFLLAVLTWLLELVEALAAMPIVALAHITPTGDGLSGSSARQAYILWIGLAIRPVLAVLGLAAGLLIFALGISIVQIAFSPLARLATVTNSGILITANIGLVLMYDVAAYAVANIAFKGITKFPDQAMRWISPFVITESQGAPAAAQASASANTVASAAVAAITQQMSQFNNADSGMKSSSAPSPNSAMFGSALFPVYDRHDDKTAAVPPPPPAADKNQGSNNAAGNPSATSVNVTTSGGANKKDKKTDDKDKKEESRYKNLSFFQSKDKPRDPGI